MMKRIALPFVFSALLLGGISSCAGDKPTDSGHGDSLRDTITSFVPGNDSLRARFRKLVTSMPVPFEILNRFSGAKLPFMPQLPNQPDNASQYADAQSQALNLGIYGADLAYMISQDKLAESGPYLRSIRRLSDAVVIPSAFDEGILNRYESNKERKDSLQLLVNTSYRRIDSTLQGNDRLLLASLVIYGGWLESIYLTTQHIGDTPQNEKNKVLYDMLAMQKPYISNITELLASFPDDSLCSQLSRDMTGVKETFPTNDLSPTEFSARLSKLRERIAAIRNRLVHIS